MNSKHKMIIVGLITLVVGFGAGFATASGGSGTYKGREMGMHRMPDGTMMQGSGQRVARGGMGSGGMQAMMHDMNAGLEGKTGDEFDKAFLEGMVVHHEGAVQMAEAALTSAGRQEIKDMSAAIIAVQKQEIGQMKKWQADWYGSTQ